MTRRVWAQPALGGACVVKRGMTVAELAEDREQIVALCTEYRRLTGRGPARSDWDVVTDMQGALRALVADPPEPMDPAVRVVDRQGEVWARVGNGWMTEQRKTRCWLDLLDERGPLVLGSSSHSAYYASDLRHAGGAS